MTIIFVNKRNGHVVVSKGNEWVYEINCWLKNPIVKEEYIPPNDWCDYLEMGFDPCDIHINTIEEARQYGLKIMDEAARNAGYSETRKMNRKEKIELLERFRCLRRKAKIV